MQIILKNSKIVFSGLKMLANTSSEIMNRYIDKILIRNTNNVVFTPTGKLVIRHYLLNGVPINWQLFQTKSKDSDEMDEKPLAVLTPFGSGDEIIIYGDGQSEAEGSRFEFHIWGDIDAYKEALSAEVTGTVYTIVDIYNTINFQ